MWVVYCTQTGEEMDRVETKKEAHDLAVQLEQDNTWEETFTYRWEA